MRGRTDDSLSLSLSLSSRVEAGPPAVADEVVAHVLLAEVGEGDGVLDEDGVVLGLGHEGAPPTQRQRVDLDGAPRVHLAGKAPPRHVPLRPASEIELSVTPSPLFGLAGMNRMHIKKSDTETVADKVCNASHAARAS